MAAPHKKTLNLNKGVNLLKDVYGKEQVRKQIYVVYRSLSIIYVFVLVVFSGVWGWTLYQTNKLNSIEKGIELKKVELSKYESLIKTLVTYSSRVDQINTIRGNESQSPLYAYDQLENIKKEAKGVLVRYKILRGSIELTFNLEDEDSVHWFENTVNQNVKSKKWVTMQIIKVEKLDTDQYEVTLSTKLGNVLPS